MNDGLTLDDALTVRKGDSLVYAGHAKGMTPGKSYSVIGTYTPTAGDIGFTVDDDTGERRLMHRTWWSKP
jgi:hypothetical protein